MKNTMPKERLVTRTIKSAIVSVKCCNRETDEMKVFTDVFTGKIDVQDKAAIMAHFNTFEWAALKILDVKITEEKWAIPERLFLQYGHRITKEEAEEIENE